MNLFQIIDQITEYDADFLARLDSRRSALTGLGKLAKNSALAVSPVLLSSLFQQAYAGTTGITSTPVDILNYALTLELLEKDFYRQFIAAGLIPAGAAANAIAKIKGHEDAHVTLLSTTITGLGGTPVSGTATTGIRFKASAMPTTYADQLALAQQLEDIGVRAYKGRVGELVGVGDSALANNAGSVNLLTVALQIHSMEARHAAHIRTMRGQAPWPNNTDDLAAAAAYTKGITAGTTPTTTAIIGTSSQSVSIPVYNTLTAGTTTTSTSTAENNYLIGSIDITSGLSNPSGATTPYTAAEAAAAFDEALQPAEVLDASRAGGLVA